MKKNAFEPERMGSGAFSEFLEKMLEKGCGFKVARGREKRYTF